ncbi:MAG: hypothetical protein QXY40_07600 [Candidatus Methanomethylicia archaeon]
MSVLTLKDIKELWLRRTEVFLITYNLRGKMRGSRRSLEDSLRLAFLAVVAFNYYVEEILWNVEERILKWRKL